MSDCAAGHAKPRYLPRLTIDSLTYHHQRSSLSSMSSSTRASIASSVSSDSSSVDSFFVYCVYDFEAADADQLSFRSNEILEPALLRRLDQQNVDLSRDACGAGVRVSRHLRRVLTAPAVQRSG